MDRIKLAVYGGFHPGVVSPLGLLLEQLHQLSELLQHLLLLGALHAALEGLGGLLL